MRPISRGVASQTWGGLAATTTGDVAAAVGVLLAAAAAGEAGAGLVGAAAPSGGPLVAQAQATKARLESARMGFALF